MARVDPPLALDHREIDHPAQEPAGDARSAAGAAGDLLGAVRGGVGPQQPRRPGDDLDELVHGVELEPGRDAEPLAERRGQQAEAGSGADEGEGLELDPHGARRRPLADDEVEPEVLERRVEDLLDHRVQPVDLVDEEHVAGVEVGQDRRQVARTRQHRARGGAEAYPELARHDLRERGLAEAGRAVEERVVHRLAAAAGALDEDGEVGARRLLADELVQRLRPQRAVGVLGQDVGAESGVGRGHALSPSAPARAAPRGSGPMSRSRSAPPPPPPPPPHRSRG